MQVKGVLRSGTRLESSLARLVEWLDRITDSIRMMPNFAVPGFCVPKAGRVIGRSDSVRNLKRGEDEVYYLVQ